MTNKDTPVRKKQSPTNVRSAEVLAITHARVLELFTYDPAIGKLRWKIKPAKRILAGSVAGQQKRDGYWYVTLDKVRVPLHHVIWVYHYGSWPVEYLTFKNGNLSDTFIENLKPLTASEKQQFEAHLHFGLSAEQKAIKYNPKGQYWRVRYKGVKLGKFLTHTAAKEVYEKALRGELDLENQKKVNLKLSLLRLRTPWRMLLQAKTPHTWTSFQHFVDTVGDRPGKLTNLIPKNPELPIGPNNFTWETITPDEAKTRREAEARPGLKQERTNWLMRKFGVTEEWYQTQLEEQNGVCAVCDRPETAIRLGKLLPLAVDHDHVTGKPRGLLCASCNIGIGSLQDNPEILQKAAAYVGRWRKVHCEPQADNVVRLVSKDYGT